MRWIGQHIYDQISRFRNDVYLEDLSLTTETSVLVVDSSGKVSKSTTLADDIIESEIDTLAGLTSFGSAGATTNIAAGDVTMYNPVDNGNPTISLGSVVEDRFEIVSTYNSNAQTLDSVSFNSYTTSTTTNDGRYIFRVDEVLLMALLDAGATVYGSVTADADGAAITSQNTTASSATEGGKLVLQSDDGAAMANDHRLGVIEFKGAEDANNTRSIGARIQAICRDTWDGSNNDADLEFYTTKATTESKVLTLDADGLATFTGQVHVEGTRNLTITNTGASGATAGGSLSLRADDDAEMANNDRLGVIEFQGREIGEGAVGYDASGNHQTGAKIQAVCEAAWTHSENGTRLEFYTMDGNAASELSLTLDSDLLATFAGAVTVTGALSGTLATVSQPNITGVGTIGTGVWQGTTIKTAYIGDDQITEDKLADTLLAEIDANTAKATNVTTNLTATTHASQITINSSDGTNVIVAEASGSIAGVMSVTHHDKLDAIEASATADQSKSDIDGLAITTVGTIDTGEWNGTAIASDQQKHLMHYDFKGYAIGDGTNYEIPVHAHDNNAPFEHNTNTGSAGTNALSVQNQIRTVGSVMPRGGTLKKWTGWATGESPASTSGTITIGLFRLPPANDSSSTVSPVLLDAITFESAGNGTSFAIEQTSFTVATVVAGDIVFSGVKTENSGQDVYFTSTLEIEF